MHRCSVLLKTPLPRSPVTSFDTISTKFHAGVRWNFFGSIMYETTKAIHNFFLFGLMDHATYGLLGSTLSIIYFASKIADFGATSSLPPFFHHIMRNKQTFRRIIGKHYLLPHIPLIIVVAVIATLIYSKHFNTISMGNGTVGTEHLTILLVLLIIALECVRYFLRIFLHAAFKSKAVVITEVILFINFVALVWIPYLILGQRLSMLNVLRAHIIDSSLCVIIFVIILGYFYRSLPSSDEPTRRPSIKHMTATKAINYTLRISRDLFTSNFLTPLFALKCGLGQAGIFYFATIVVNTIQSTIKMSIHYPANGLLSHIKESSHVTKKAAFSMLCQKLTKLITPIIIFMVINYQGILKLGHQTSATTTTLAMALILLFITLIESFFLLYEQFYVIEETSLRLFMFKLLEFVLFYAFVIRSTSTTTITLIALVALIKLFSFGLTAINAFARWHIAPDIKLNVKTIIGWFIVSLLFSLLF